MSAPNHLAVLPFLTLRSGLANSATPEGVTRLLTQLAAAHEVPGKARTHLMNIVVWPFALATAVTMAVAPFITEKTDMDVVGPIPGIVWFTSAIVLSVRGARKRRRALAAHISRIAQDSGFPADVVGEFDAAFAEHDELIKKLQANVSSLDGYQMSNDLNKRIIEALAVAYLQAQLVPDIRFSDSLGEQLEGLRTRKKAIDQLREGNSFNMAVSSATTAYALGEKLLVARRGALDALARLGFPGVKLLLLPPVAEALALLEKQAASRDATPRAEYVAPAPPPQTPRDAFEVGREAFKAKSWHASKAAFEQVLAASPGHPAASFFLGATLVELDRVTEALPLLRTAVAADESQLDYQFVLGMALGRLERYSEGEVHMARAAYLGHPQARDLLARTGMDWCRNCGSPFRVGARCPNCA